MSIGKLEASPILTRTLASKIRRKLQNDTQTHRQKNSNKINCRRKKEKTKTVPKKTTVKKKNKNIIVKIQDLLDRVKEDITSPINEYTLQMGAFGKKSNAEYQREILINGGYDARIESINSNSLQSLF